MAATWIRFNAAMKAQSIDRDTFLPVKSRFQPYAGYWALCCAFVFLWLVDPRHTGRSTHRFS